MILGEGFWISLLVDRSLEMIELEYSLSKVAVTDWVKPEVKRGVILGWRNEVRAVVVCTSTMRGSNPIGNQMKSMFEQPRLSAARRHHVKASP